MYAVETIRHLHNALDASAALSRVGAGDKALEIINGGRLGADDPIHAIADRDKAREFAFLQHRNVPDPIFCHYLHAFLNGITETDCLQVDSS